MKWFQGSIPGAIQEAHAKRVIFVVYVNGSDEPSEEMSALWDDPAVKAACDEAGFVGLRLEADSENCKHFSKIYPVVCVPCAFFIGENGVPLEVTGKVTAQELLDKMEKAKELHQTQLRGEPLGSPLNPSGTSAGRVTPTDAQPIPIDASLTQSPVRPVDQAASETASPSSSIPAAPPAAAATSSGPEADSDTTGGAGTPSTAISDEEKEAKIKRAQELRERIQHEKQQKESEKDKEDEKKRREMGQQVTKLKQWQAEQEAKELREELKKNREDEKRARQRVKEQIAKDREDRAARFKQEKADRERLAQEKKEMADSTKQQEQAQRNAASLENTRLQFRLPDGSAVTQQFSSQETLGAARSFLKEKVGTAYGSFTLACNYPKKDFTEADMSKSLLDLGLAPSSALVVLPGSRSILTTSGGPVSSSNDSFIWTILAPLVALWNFIYNLLFATPAQPHGAYNPATPGQSQPDDVDEALRRTRESRGNRPKSSYGVRSRKEGNLHRLSADDDEDMSTYNGNSTQQM